MRKMHGEDERERKMMRDVRRENKKKVVRMRQREREREREM